MRLTDDQAQAIKQFAYQIAGEGHEYEEDADRLTQFFTEMVKATPELFEHYQRLLGFCAKAYGIKPE